jgi:hypothetical protein
VLKAAERAARGANGELTDARLHSAATFIVEEYLVCQSARDAAQVYTICCMLYIYILYIYIYI